MSLFALQTNQIMLLVGIGLVLFVFVNRLRRSFMPDQRPANIADHLPVHAVRPIHGPAKSSAAPGCVPAPPVRSKRLWKSRCTSLHGSSRRISIPN